MANEEYKELMKKYEEIYILGSISGVLTWDTETTMPRNAIQHRSKQFRYISEQTHKLSTNEQFGLLLNKLSDNDDLNKIEKRNVELLKRRYDTASKIPIDLVGEMSAQSKKTNESWKTAKSKQNFSIVMNDLKKLIELNIDYSTKLADIRGINDPYSARISERDFGFSVDQITKYFNEAKSFLIPFIQQTLDKQRDLDFEFRNRPVPKTVQVKVVEEIAKSFKYDFNRETGLGRIGEVEHPLTIGCGPQDVRITVKYGDFIQVMNATAHELGHGLHGIHKNQEYVYQPINSFGFPSLGECTSRYTENKIGNSREFQSYFFPIMQKLTNGIFDDLDFESYFRGFTRVKPHTSRMEADELTYGLHIIIRFELERDLFAGKISVEELPSLWNEKYKEYLGVNVPNDSLGIMQDLHWYNVYWAYFQGYFLGDLMGSQLHHHMNSTNPEWKTNMMEGDLSTVLNYNIENVYSKGALYDPLDLVKHVTGESLQTKYFVDYLKEKYTF
ncbi:MAG: carboxypeptidase M32 [Candidatus Heimdallarchaeota archaeon]|nr:carboxypeptidase M32 [Candidatus Heimdallarchaeota archaeon]